MLSNEELYALSIETNAILIGAKALLGLNLLRFKHLVDGSAKGFDCTYAQLTRRHFAEQRQSELSTLLDIRESLNSLIAKLEASEEQEDEAEDHF